MDIQALQVKDVLQVYVGRAGKCCCGCNGEHVYNSAHVELGTKTRGYAVTADEVDDEQVLHVLRTIQANASSLEDFTPGDDNIAVKIGRKVFIAYLVPSVIPVS